MTPSPSQVKAAREWLVTERGLERPAVFDVLSETSIELLIGDLYLGGLPAFLAEHPDTNDGNEGGGR